MCRWTTWSDRHRLQVQTSSSEGGSNIIYRPIRHHVVFSQEWYHFFSQPDPPRVGSTPVASNALHLVLRAFEATGVRTAVARTDVTVVEEVVPSEGVTDIIKDSFNLFERTPRTDNRNCRELR